MQREQGEQEYIQYLNNMNWGEVRKLSGHIASFYEREVGQDQQLSRPQFLHLYNIAVHLLRAIENLDPEAPQRNALQMYSSSSTLQNSKTESMIDDMMLPQTQPQHSHLPPPPSHAVLGSHPRSHLPTHATPEPLSGDKWGPWWK